MTISLDLLQDWYRRVWIEQDLGAVEDFFAPRVGADGILADGQVRAEDFRALIPAIHALVRDLSITIERSHEMGDWLWTQIVFAGHAAQGLEVVRTRAQVMVRIEAGRIAEAYNIFDALTFFEQLGQLPKDAQMLLLSGETLG